MTPLASTFLIPAEDATWRVWKDRATAPAEVVDTPSHYDSRSRPVIVGLPATACRTLSLILPQSDHSLTQEMVVSQLERRGIKGPNGGAPAFRWHLLGNSGPHAIVSVDVLAEPFPHELTASAAFNYTAALRLVQLPVAQLVVIEEQGDLVLAANHQGRLQHSHVFAQRPADAAQVAMEVTLTKLALEAQPGTSPITGITLVGQWDDAFVADLRHHLGLTVQEVERLNPSAKLNTKGWTELLPSSVATARVDAAKRRTWLRLALLGAFALAAIIFLGITFLQKLQTEANELTASVAATKAPAAEIKFTNDRWNALLPATDPKRYPLVILNQVTALLPPSGIVFREVEIKTNETEVRGEARDAQTAFTLLEDLKKHKQLGVLEWTMPQPQIRDNKTATFRLQGKRKS
jgi:hypothetical protein